MISSPTYGNLLTLKHPSARESVVRSRILVSGSLGFDFSIYQVPGVSVARNKHGVRHTKSWGHDPICKGSEGDSIYLASGRRGTGCRRCCCSSSSAASVPSRGWTSACCRPLPWPSKSGGVGGGASRRVCLLFFCAGLAFFFGGGSAFCFLF